MYIPELERDVLYEDSDFEIDSDDEPDLKQSELPCLTKWNPIIPRDCQIPSQLSGERPQIPKFLEPLTVEDHLP